MNLQELEINSLLGHLAGHFLGRGKEVRIIMAVFTSIHTWFVASYRCRVVNKLKVCIVSTINIVEHTFDTFAVS